MGGQALVKAAGGLLVEAHDGAVPVDPGAAVQGAGLQLPDQHGGGIASVLHLDPIAFAAPEAPGHVIGGGPEDDHRAPAQLRRPCQGMLHQKPPIAPPLMLRRDADGAEGQDVPPLPGSAREGGAGIEDASQDLPVQLQHEVQLRHKVRVAPHDVDQVVLMTAGDIEIVEGPPGQRLYAPVVGRGFVSDVQHAAPPWNVLGPRPCAPDGNAAESGRRPPVLLLILYQRLSGLSTRIGRFFTGFARRKTGGAPARREAPRKTPGGDGSRL